MPERPMLERALPLLDLEIERGGDGRTVIAYAATFGDWYPVQDQFGDYDESIHRAAFNRAIGRGIDRIQVLFNHGRTLHGTPSERFSMPLGTPLEITADARGLLTRTRYARTEMADEVLELIRDGAIRAQSFRGPIIRSAPPAVVGGRQRIERMELGLVEYGPAPFAVNAAAEMVAVRSAAALVDEIGGMSPEERAELARLLSLVPGVPSDAPALDPADPAPVEDPAPEPEAIRDDPELLAIELDLRRRRANP